MFKTIINRYIYIFLNKHQKLDMENKKIIFETRSIPTKDILLFVSTSAKLRILFILVLIFCERYKF